MLTNKMYRGELVEEKDGRVKPNEIEIFILSRKYCVEKISMSVPERKCEFWECS